MCVLARVSTAASLLPGGVLGGEGGRVGCWPGMALAARRVACLIGWCTDTSSARENIKKLNCDGWMELGDVEAARGSSEFQTDKFFPP